MPALNMVRYAQKPFLALYERVYDKSKIKMKGYTAIQKKLLIIVYTLWKKQEAYDPDYLKPSSDVELAPSFVSLESKTVPQSGTAQDEHPTKSRCMPSFVFAK